MYQVIIVVHVLLGLGVVSLVLLQQGKGADAGAAFGSASSGSVFGAQGASSFLSRTTAILAALFFSTSLGLAVLSGYQEGEVDLMDATETEEIIADVPLINGADNLDSDSLPELNEEVVVSPTIESVTEEIIKQMQESDNKAQDAMLDTQTDINEPIDNIKESEILSE